MTDPGFIPDSEFVPDPPVASAAAPGPGFIADKDFVPDSQKYGGIGQQVLAGIEGAGHGLMGPVMTAAEAALTQGGFPGLSPEEQAGREAAHPWTHGLAEVAGFVAPAVLSGGASAAARAGLEVPEVVGAGVKGLEKYSQSGLLSKVGEAVEKAAPAFGIGGPGAGVVSKIGTTAARFAAENAVYQGGDEVSKYINGNPDSVQTALGNVGLSALIGGTLGGGIGTVSALWRGTAGSKVGQLLHGLSERAGGIDGVEPSAVENLISKAGMDVKPEIRAGMSNDPFTKETFSTLRQSDTTNKGREFQETLKDFHAKSGEALSDALGRAPGEIPEAFDKYENGKTIGRVLADEVDSRLGPLKNDYEDLAGKYKGKDLDPSIGTKMETSRADIHGARAEVEEATKELRAAEAPGYGHENPEAAADAAARLEKAQNTLKGAERAASAPGTVDALSEKIAGLVSDEKWGLSPSSDIMREVNRVQKELPNLKTLDDLSAYIKRVGENMQSDPMNGPLSRAGGKIKEILRGAEGELIGAHIGSEEGVESLTRYSNTRDNYHAEIKLKEALEDRLGKLGATASYSQRIRAMAQTDGEGIIRKLSGKNDADLLNLLQKQFPATAEALRKAHIDELLSKAMNAEGGLDAGKALKAIDKLSPQLKSFIIPPEAAERVSAIGAMLEKLKDPNHNFSNTGRTIDKAFQHLPGTAVGMISMIMGHNPAISMVLGALTKYIAKDAPDAARLGLLKWLGSSKPIEAGAFKTMVDLMHNTIKGDDLMSRATKNILNGASKIIPEHLMPSDGDLHALDKKIKEAHTNPNLLENTGAHASYYLPNHGTALTATATTAVNYLNTIRPVAMKQSPLDPEIEPNESAKADYNRALSIAQQPLLVTHLLKEKTLTAEDVGHLKNLYPEFYSRLCQKATEQMIHHVSKGNIIPFEMRSGLSTLLGQPLDSSLAPQNIQTNQATFAQANAEQAQKNQTKTKPSSKGMREMKTASRYSLNHSDTET